MGYDGRINKNRVAGEWFTSMHTTYGISMHINIYVCRYCVWQRLIIAHKNAFHFDLIGNGIDFSGVFFFQMFEMVSRSQKKTSSIHMYEHEQYHMIWETRLIDYVSVSFYMNLFKCLVKAHKTVLFLFDHFHLRWFRDYTYWNGLEQKGADVVCS